jgi:4-hydroxy-2-oxoheptanedioate aldolase
MKIPVNRFKSRLLAGEIQYGLWVALTDPIAAEISAAAGFDWLLVDAEHAPYDIKSLVGHLQAIAPYNTSPIVRPPVGDVVVIKQLLDIGAQTLLIPMVDTAEQAEMLVRATRYPPKGIRGVGTSMARAARWNHVDNYLHSADEEICLIVQVETATAVDNLEAIVAVEGVDAVFIGPSDLAASLGHLGDPGHPDVMSVVAQSFKTILEAGKGAGVLAVVPELAREYQSQGATFIGSGVDTAILAGATKALAASMRSDDEEDSVSRGTGY